MSATQQLSITLPLEMAETVKSKVASGEYASESDVVRHGIHALLVREQLLNDWLHEQVGPAFDALKADPSRALTIDQVKARLDAEHKIATTKK